MLKLNTKSLRTKEKLKFYISLSIIILLLLFSFFPEIFAPYKATKSNYNNVLSLPSWLNYLGTDELGRDVFSRLVYGTKVSLFVAFSASIISLIFGGLYGCISGLYGAYIDEIMMKIVDIFYSIPDLLLISIFILIFGKGLLGITLALSLLSWMRVARISRSSVLELKNLPFITSAKLKGFGKTHIIFKEILPNILAPLIVTFTFTIPSSILAESTLSFLGIGISSPEISWGLMASTGWEGIRSYPHLIIFPCIFIFISTICFLNIGNYIKRKFIWKKFF